MTLDVLAAIGALSAGDASLRAHLIACYQSKNWTSKVTTPGGSVISETGPSSTQSAKMLQECLAKWDVQSKGHAPKGFEISGNGEFVRPKVEDK